jgi:hypothetical protein
MGQARFAPHGGARHCGIQFHGTVSHQTPSKKKQGRQDKNWVSPDIAKILKESGVEVEGTSESGDVGSDEYYDEL